MNKPLRFAGATFLAILQSRPLSLILDLRFLSLNAPTWISRLTLGLCFMLAVLSAQAQSYGPNGTTVAGTGSSGSAANQLSFPSGLYVDGSGAIYVGDVGNSRIQKWAAGATSGTTVAGGNGAGSGDNQMRSPNGVYMDGSGAVYVADANNHRIQKWAAGATSGTTVAGGNGQGPGTNQLNNPNGVYVDGAGAIYVADRINHRIQKFPPNSTSATSGTTVAGTGSSGSSANQLNLPSGIYVDGSGAIYVADQNNNRIQKWASGASSGTTVAGGNGSGSAADKLSNPYGVWVDGSGAVYVADGSNNRIQKWASGATSGTTVAGGNGSGSAANRLNSPVGVYVDGAGAVYVADQFNHRIQKFSICTLTTAILSPGSTTLTCSLTSLTLTAASSETAVLWSTGATTPDILVSSAGPYSVTVTASDGCKATATTTISSNTVLPALSLNPSSPNLTCTITSLTLTAASSETAVLWSTGATTPNILVSSAGPYSVTVTGANGCQASAATTISLNSAFVATATASSSTVLVGSTVSLSASGGTAYQWITPPATLFSNPPTGPVVLAAPQTIGFQTFTVVVTNGPLCSQTLTVSVTATAPPSVSVVADLTPSLFARPSILYGSSTMSVVVNVVEINNQATSGPVTLKITKDAKVSLTFPASATTVGGRTVQNSGWSFDDTITPGYYTLTSMAPIPAGGVLSVGLEGTLSPGSTMGDISISATVSGGDAGGVNNVDADKIQYFP